jgi:hypothetical protein
VVVELLLNDLIQPRVERLLAVLGRMPAGRFGWKADIVECRRLKLTLVKVIRSPTPFLRNPELFQENSHGIWFPFTRDQIWLDQRPADHPIMSKHAERGRQPPHAVAKGDPPAVVLIKQEHQMFRTLFDRVEQLEGLSLVTLASEICVRLAVHILLEEEILYPALKPVIGIDEIDEGIVEHEVARRLIIDLTRMTGAEELYKSKVHVLGEETIHHIDEEDRGLLRDARKAWEAGKVDLVLIGHQLEVRRDALYGDFSTIASDSGKLEVESMGKAIEDLPNPAAPPPAAERIS